MTLSPEFIEKLKKLAKQKTCEENSDEEFFNPSDWFGGNYDDAYNGGVTTGEILTAREVLDALGIDY